ncbi:hypothetical protein Nmel_002526 [Mimus melanotis]
MLAPSSQIAGVRCGAQHTGSWSRSPSTTDNCLKFMLQLGQLFEVFFLFKKHICQEFAQAYLLIWNFSWTLNEPVATRQDSSLSHGPTSSLFKQVRHFQPHSPDSSMPPSQQQSAGHTQCLANPAWSKANDKGKYPYQNKRSPSLKEMLFPAFYLWFRFFFIFFICPAYYIGKPYYFFILFHFKTIKTICQLVNTNILSFLDQSVSCLCSNGSLTLFFLQDRQETL